MRPSKKSFEKCATFDNVIFAECKTKIWRPCEIFSFGFTAITNEQLELDTRNL
jgi:hypothetical protein